LYRKDRLNGGLGRWSIMKYKIHGKKGTQMYLEEEKEGRKRQ
jgi:hypothetical protein